MENRIAFYGRKYSSADEMPPAVLRCSPDEWTTSLPEALCNAERASRYIYTWVLCFHEARPRGEVKMAGRRVGCGARPHKEKETSHDVATYGRLARR